MAMQLNDIITDGTAKFQVVKVATTKDLDDLSNTYETKANAITGLSISGNTITYTKGNSTTDTITIQDNNSTTKLIVGASNSTDNATTTNGNTYLRLFDNSTARNSINIKGSGAASVVSNDNGVITISSTDTTYNDATTSTHGLMSTSDKSKLNGIAENANNYSLPTATSSTLGGVIVGSNISNSDGTISLSSSNVTNALGFTPMNSTTSVNNVSQTVSTTNNTYPVLATNTANKTDSSAGTSIFSTKIKMNPSTGVITANKFDGAICTPTSFTIATNAWTNNASESSEYKYYADISVNGLTTSDYAEVNFNRTSLSAILDANMSASGETMSGKIRIFAESAPTTSISGEYVILKGGN